MILFFHRIHPLNFPFAWISQYFFEVKYWRSEKIPQSWLKQFQWVDPALYFTSDEWKSISRKVYDEWKKFVSKMNKKIAIKIPFYNINLDFLPHWLQWLAIEYEREWQFLRLAERAKNISWGNKRIFIAGLTGLEIQKPFRVLFSFTERLRLWCLSFIQFFKIVYQLFYPSTKFSKNYTPFNYLWSGVSASEIPSAYDQIDFGFLHKRGLLSSQDSLFLLPREPSEKELKFISDVKYRWSVLHRFSGLLPLNRRVAAVFTMSFGCLWIFLRHPFRSYTPQLLDFLFQACPWIQVGLQYRPNMYLSSVSASWPESVAVSAMNALGIRTAVWHYSANVYGFATNNKEFDDLSIPLSVGVAKEVFVWTQDVAELFSARSVLSNVNTPVYNVIGPLMAGDSRWMSLKPSEVRKKKDIIAHSNCYYVSVFDVPPVTDEARRQIGFGPNVYFVEMLEQFFEDLMSELEKFDSLRLILKPKRSLQDPQREYSAGMWKLLDPRGSFIKEKRILVLDHQIDPYLPIAMADLCIGLPFTSPVLAGINSGRRGIFYDPLGSVRYFRPKSLERNIVIGKKDLHMCLSKCVEGHKMSKDMNHIVGTGDPAENFVRYLKTT